MIRVLRVQLVALAALSAGCATHVKIDSRPIAGEVRTQSGARYRLPADVPVRWRPFARPVVTVSAPGYRAVDVPLHLGWGPLSLHGAHEYEISLVPVHGPVGTWTPDDVP